MSVVRQPVVLLTLGRLPVALELARACAAAGARVIVAEPWRWHLARLSRAVDRCYRTPSPVDDAPGYLDRLLQIIEHEHVTTILPVSEETPFVAALHERLPAGARLLCPTRERVLALHDKWQFLQLAQRAGLPVPSTASADDATAIGKAPHLPRVLKPRLSCSGNGVVMLAPGESVPNDRRTAADLVQTRLSGPACCSFSLVHEGQVIVTCVYESVLDYGSVAVAFERIDTPLAVDRFVHTLARHTTHTGMLSLDFMQDSQACWQAIECNPRATSGVHLLARSTIWQGVLRMADRGEIGAETQPPSLDEVSARRRQEFWSSLTVLVGELRRARLPWPRVRQLFSTRDITWQRRDPLPFLFSWLVMGPVLWRSFRQGRPIVQIMTLDIGWYVDVEDDRKCKDGE